MRRLGLGLAGLPLLLLPFVARQGPGPLDVGRGGRTWCVQGQPVSALNPMLDSAASAAAAAHEAWHRRQLAGDCERRLATLQADPHARLHAEAGALCAEGRTLARPARVAHVAAVALLLAPAFPGIPDDTLTAAVGRGCTPLLFPE